MTGQMIDFTANESTTPGYLATPAHGPGPGIVVLHAWWGLTEPFRQTCDHLAEAGFVALAPDLYRGKTTASVEQAKAWGQGLDDEQARGRTWTAQQYAERDSRLAHLGVRNLSSRFRPW